MFSGGSPNTAHLSKKPKKMPRISRIPRYLPSGDRFFTAIFVKFVKFVASAAAHGNSACLGYALNESK
jgi:hypothetical protein